MSKHHHKRHADATILIEHEPHPRWVCGVHLSHADDKCVAHVELADGNAVYECHGRAPISEGFEELAEQLAVARALSGLSHQLLHDAARDLHDANAALVALSAASDISA